MRTMSHLIETIQAELKSTITEMENTLGNLNGGF
jgi:hypothetical protein